MAGIMGGEETDLDKIAEDELLRLQRQYRIMEMERTAMCTAAKPKLRKQKQLLQSLMKEYDQLLLDLKLSKSVSNVKRDTYVGNEMSDLLLEQENIQMELSNEKFQIGEIDYLLKQVEKEVFALKCQQVTEKEIMEKVVHSQQRVAQLENRLEVTTKKFNAVNTSNFKMRQDIDHLIQERAQFNIVWSKTLNTLAGGKSLMMELVEQSTVLYDQREEWCHKLQTIRERAQYDQVEHTHEMGELQRELDHDSKLQQFLAVKGSVRVLAELEAKEAARRRAQRDKEAAVQERYRDILKQIQEFSEETDLERLTAKFTKQDEENYALFNYVNEVNHELEALANNVAELRVNIEDLRAQKIEREAKEQETIEGLKENFREEVTKTEQAEKSKSKAQETLTNSLIGIQDLYAIMDCSAAPILQLLGTTDINVHNVMLYLKTIERKTMDVVNCPDYAENVKKIMDENRGNKGKISTVSSTKVKIATKESKKSKQKNVGDKIK